MIKSIALVVMTVTSDWLKQICIVEGMADGWWKLAG